MYKIISKIEKNFKKVNLELLKKDPKKYLELFSKELKSAGIDTSKIYLQSFIDNIETNQLSQYLDECVYEPIFEYQSGEHETNVLESIISFGGSKKIETQLEIPKLFFASIFLILLCAGLTRLSRYYSFAVLYLILAYDSFIVSYNCYKKRYYSIASKKMCSDPGNILKSVFTWAQKSVGCIVSPDADPLSKLKENVNWEYIAEDTILKLIYPYLKKNISELFKKN